MGVDVPHRRQAGVSSAYVLSLDIVGPFVAGRDPGGEGTAKYCLVGTLPVPIQSVPEEPLVEGGDPPGGEPAGLAMGPGLDDAGLLGEEEVPLADAADVHRLNDEARQQMRDDMGEIMSLQHVSFVEMLPSRHTRDLLHGMNLIRAQARCLGLPIVRVHTDRAKEFLARDVRRWCAEHGYLQTMTAGDDHQANGRVEGEINQFKRRLRVLLQTSGVDTEFWPCVARHVMKERRRSQLLRLGLPQPELLPFFAPVLVKVKRWHKAGALADPYKEVRIYGPSPLMTSGWLVRDPEGAFQHARIALLPDPLAERARFELEVDDRPGEPRRRLHGKQKLAELQVGPVLAELRAGGESISSSCSLDAADSALDASDVPSTPSETASSALGMCGKEYLEDRRREHRALREILGELHKAEPMSREAGEQQGRCAEAVLEQLWCLENYLEEESRKEENEVVRACSLQAQVEVDGEAPKVLQTYTVPLSKVKANLSEWIPSMRDEYEALTDSMKAVKKWRESDLKQQPGYATAEYAPSKLVNTIKAPNGRHRSRIVICGNMVEDLHTGKAARSADKHDLYAGGVDGVTARCVFRKAAHHQWCLGSIDVKCAFLLAPRQESRRMLLTRPPRVFVDSGLCPPDEIWEVSTAMYGLETSPADWTAYRNTVLSRMQWKEAGRFFEVQPSVELNLWNIFSYDNEERTGDQRMEGNLILYVDDMLAAAPRNIVTSLFDRIQAEWTTSPPEFVDDQRWSKFCGFELKWFKAENGEWHLLVAQPSYIGELLKRHEIARSRPTPIPKIEFSVENEVKPEDVKAAQGLIGELLWISIRTRPDISFAVSLLAQNIVQSPRQVSQYALGVIEFLGGSKDLGLCYSPCRGDRGPDDILPLPRSMELLELYSDISFAPSGGRSHQGVVACYGGQVVQWEAVRQPFTTLSTAESELVGYIESMTMGESLSVIVDVLECGAWSERGAQKVLYGDNLSALTIIQCPDGPWRTRHLRLRASVLRERVKSGQWLARHLPGSDLMADYLTKIFSVASGWQKFWKMANMVRSGGDLKEQLAEHHEMPVTDKVAKLVGWTSALGFFASFSPQSEALKFAKMVGLAAVTLGLVRACRECSPKRETKMAKMQNEGTPRVDSRSSSRLDKMSIPTESSDLIAERRPREQRGGNEPGLSSFVGSSSNLNHCPTGCPSPVASVGEAMEREESELWWKDVSRGGEAEVLRSRSWTASMKALRFKDSQHQPRGEPAMINYTAPWLDYRLQEAPKRTSDRWWKVLISGWYVREHGSTRKSLFHPIHKGTPFEPLILEEDRITVMFPVNGDDVRVVEDVWAVPKDDSRQQPWRGYTLFKVKRGFIPPGGENGLWGPGHWEAQRPEKKWGVGPLDIQQDAGKRGYFKSGMPSSSGSSSTWDNPWKEEIPENAVLVSYQKSQKKGILDRAGDTGIFGADMSQDVTDHVEKRSVHSGSEAGEIEEPKAGAVFSSTPKKSPSEAATCGPNGCGSWVFISQAPSASADDAGESSSFLASEVLAKSAPMGVPQGIKVSIHVEQTLPESSGSGGRRGEN